VWTGAHGGRQQMLVSVELGDRCSRFAPNLGHGPSPMIWPWCSPLANGHHRQHHVGGFYVGVPPSPNFPGIAPSDPANRSVPRARVMMARLLVPAHWRPETVAGSASRSVACRQLVTRGATASSVEPSRHGRQTGTASKLSAWAITVPWLIAFVGLLALAKMRGSAGWAGWVWQAQSRCKSCARLAVSSLGLMIGLPLQHGATSPETAGPDAGGQRRWPGVL